MSEDSKQDQLLKRAQVTIAILAGLATLIVGVYNAKKVMFPETAGRGEISLIVRTPDGRPVHNAQVELLSTSNALLSSDDTDSDGSETKKDIEAGNYILKVSAGGYEPQIIPVQVAAKKTAQIRLALRPLATAQAAPIRSAIQDVGASWISKLGKPKSDETETKTKV